MQVEEGVREHQPVGITEHRREFGHVGRHAHELPAGQRPERAQRPDRGRRGPRAGALIGQPGLGDQRGPLRTGDQQCLGSLVNGGAGLVVGVPGRPIAVVSFTIAAGRIAAIDLITDRLKLTRVEGED